MENEFSPFVRILGKGKTGSRSLTQAEAAEAMSLILSGRVEDVQLGAFLMLLRVKEESAEELAGFAQACRQFVDAADSKASAGLTVDLDWSSYAGKRRQPHWFILAAFALAQSGFKVCMHGARGHTEGRVYTQEIMQALGFAAAADVAEAYESLNKVGLCYLPIENFCKPMQDIIGLRPLFGLRSPVHTLCRLINPLAANATVQSVFHPSYMQGHHQATILLGEKNSAVLKGDAGEVECRPHASVKLLVNINGQSIEEVLPRRAAPPEDQLPNAESLIELWANGGDGLEGYGANAVVGTIALALLAMQAQTSLDDAYAHAEQLWIRRNRGALPVRQ